MLSPLTGCRCAAFSLALGLTLATGASAQYRGPEVPCDMPLFLFRDSGTGGSPTFGPSILRLEAGLATKKGDLLATRLGIDKSTIRSLLEELKQELDPDLNQELKHNALPVVADHRRDHLSYLWRVGSSWTHATPDAFEGDPSGVDGTTIDLLTLEVARSFRIDHDRISQFGIRIPHVRLRIPDAYGAPDASGIGDATLFLDLALPRGNPQNYRFISVDATLPTGDEDKLLGIGEPLVRLGMQQVWRRAERPDADELLVALLEHHLSMRSGGWSKVSNPPRQVPTGWPPDLQISLGLAYLHDFRDEELSHLELASSVILTWDRLAWEWGFVLTHELGDGPSEGGRDEATQLDLFSEVRIPLKRGKYRAWHLNVGVRTRLTDDGLSDRFTPTIGVMHLRN